MNESKLKIAALEHFSDQKMSKIDLFKSSHLLLGLNCLESGQSQHTHAHEDADKFYYVVRGSAKFSVGDTVIQASAGELVLCPSGVVHGILTALEQTTVLVGIAPWS